MQTADETAAVKMDAPNDPRLEEMIQAGVFYGRKKSKTHPRMKEFIFGNRGGIEIIDIQKTQLCLDEAMKLLAEKVREGVTLLLVGTQPMASRDIEAIAKEAGFPYVTKRWVGGTLTNFKTISDRIEHFKKLKADLSSDALEKYTKKERVTFEKEIGRLRELFGGLENLTRPPGLLVVVDPVIHATAVREARRSRIPTIALVGTDADPGTIEHLIPGNNRSTKSIQWFLGEVAKAIREGKAATPQSPEKQNEDGISAVNEPQLPSDVKPA